MHAHPICDRPAGGLVAIAVAVTLAFTAMPAHASPTLANLSGARADAPPPGSFDARVKEVKDKLPDQGRIRPDPDHTNGPSPLATWRSQLPMDQLARDQGNATALHNGTDTLAAAVKKNQIEQHEIDSRHGLSRIYYLISKGYWGQLIRDFSFIGGLVLLLILSVPFALVRNARARADRKAPTSDLLRDTTKI